MMSGEDTSRSLRDQLITEIAEEMISLKGDALDAFLIEAGEDPESLFTLGSDALSAAVRRQKMVRINDARAHLRQRKAQRTAAILSFDMDRKQTLLKDIKKYTRESGEMTLAARNQKIDSEDDLDSFLEACVRLGIIDEEGNLKK